MATFRRRGRPPSEGLFTPSEERVLELIRLSKTNLEIANELRISVAGVKYHVTNMLGKVGAQDRAALASWRGTDQKPRTRRRLSLSWPSILTAGKVATVGGCMVAFGVATWTIFQFAGRGGGDVSQPVPAAPNGYSSVTVAQLEGLGMVDAGRILRPLSGSIPVFAGSIRQSASVAVLTGPAEVVMGVGEPWQFQGGYFVPANPQVPNWVALSGRVAGRPVAVQLWAEDMALSESTTIEVGDEGTRIVRTKDATAPPELLLAVTGAGGMPLRAAIAQDGHLYVDLVPTPLTAVVDAWSGELLDVRGSVKGLTLGTPAAGLFRFTACDTDGDRSCYVSVRSDVPLVAPVDGVLSCRSADEIEIRQANVALRVRRVDSGYGGSPKFECVNHPVVAGEVIGPSGVHWVYSASDAITGAPLSVGATFEGTLYIGKFGPTAQCPCRSGS